MIHITDKEKCCGCNACVQSCPKHCISMREDNEGFLYPVVDRSLCVDCGLCEQVCPELHPEEPGKPLQILAARNRNEEQRLRSSSGGLFVLLAEQTIRQGGVVFGARFDENWEVEHGYAETLEDIEPFMRSKYLQSRIGENFKKAEQFLKQGRKVLFVGTSCQIAGMRRYLRKDYDNLLTVDFICHGVPSPGVWRRYLEELREKSARSAAAGRNTVLNASLKSMPAITGINFREKQLGGYGWKKYGFVVRAKSPSKGDRNSVLSSTIFYEDAFMRAFLRNFILRPSCYNCPAKNGRSGSDLTIADFWGIDATHPEFDDDKGTGVIFVNSAKGETIVAAIDIDCMEVSYDEAVRSNPSYYKAVGIPVGRMKFWQGYYKGMSVSEAERLASWEPVYIRIKKKVRALAGRILCKLRKSGK